MFHDRWAGQHASDGVLVPQAIKILCSISGTEHFEDDRALVGGADGTQKLRPLPFMQRSGDLVHHVFLAISSR
jgi:hypothetical protein